jgi:D-amino-acid oxidase
MHELKNSGVLNFSRNTHLIQEHNIDPGYGVVDAYQHLAPIIDTDQCMKWLMAMVQQKGGIFITKTIQGDLFDQEDDLRVVHHADVIVNATGLAGKEIAGDSSCYPIRGALIRVINDGKDFAKVTSALTMTTGAVYNEIVFIVPRTDNILLLGGIVQLHEQTLNLSLESPIIKRMRSRCEFFSSSRPCECTARYRISFCARLAPIPRTQFAR